MKRNLLSLARYGAVGLAPFLLAEAWGQVSPAMGNIRGMVRDGLQHNIRGAVVTVRTLQGDEVRSVTTREDGRFLVPLLTPASYELRIEAAGYAPLVVDRLD